MQIGKISHVDWFFYSRPSYGRQFSDPAERSFKKTYESLVRESIQNSMDAASRARDQKMADGPCKITYQHIRLEKEDKEEFIRGVDNQGKLRKHVAESDNLPKDDIPPENYMDPDNGNPLNLLVIHDYNTTGLYGIEQPDDKDIESPFSALCRDTSNSDKGSGSQGGSYGMGKSVYWIFSKLKTVLFLSYTKNNEDEMKYRLFGVSKLGYHKLDGNQYAGVGDFGKLKSDKDIGDYNSSVWYEDVHHEELEFIPESIRNNREGEIGTSIILLELEEFEESSNTGEQWHQSIYSEVYKWFWPAISIGLLEVTVNSDDGSPLKTNKNYITRELKPYKIVFDEMMRKFGQGKDCRHGVELEEKTVKFPPKIEETDRSKRSGRFAIGIITNHNMITHGTEYGKEEADKIAWMRGSFSIVRYRRTKPGIGVENVWGVMMAGEAIGSKIGRDENILIDDFLRFAENPSHDKWTHEDSQLYERYGSHHGAKKYLTLMKRKFSDIEGLLKIDKEFLEDSPPSSLLNLFPVSASRGRISAGGNKHGGGGGGSSRSIVNFSVLEQVITDNGMIEKVHAKSRKVTWQLNVQVLMLDENYATIGRISPDIAIKVNDKIVSVSDKFMVNSSDFDFETHITNIPQQFSDAILGIRYGGN